jgi:hypothetical protein
MPSAVTNLIGNTLSASKILDNGAKGLFTTQVSALLTDSDQISAKYGETRTHLLTDSFQVSKLSDKGAKGLWPADVCEVIADAKALVSGG